MSFSRMLSTATLEGAVAKIRCPQAATCRMTSTKTVVFPVPGGPWTTATSGAARQEATASRWNSLRPELKKFISLGLPVLGGRSPNRTSRSSARRFFRASGTAAMAFFIWLKVASEPSMSIWQPSQRRAGAGPLIDAVAVYSPTL